MSHSLTTSFDITNENEKRLASSETCYSALVSNSSTRVNSAFIKLLQITNSDDLLSHLCEFLVLSNLNTFSNTCSSFSDILFRCRFSFRHHRVDACHFSLSLFMYEWSYPVLIADAMGKYNSISEMKLFECHHQHPHHTDSEMHANSCDPTLKSLSSFESSSCSSSFESASPFTFAIRSGTLPVPQNKADFSVDYVHVSVSLWLDVKLTWSFPAKDFVDSNFRSTCVKQIVSGHCLLASADRVSRAKLTVDGFLLEAACRSYQMFAVAASPCEIRTHYDVCCTFLHGLKKHIDPLSMSSTHKYNLSQDFDFRLSPLQLWPHMRHSLRALRIAAVDNVSAVRDIPFLRSHMLHYHTSICGLSFRSDSVVHTALSANLAGHQETECLYVGDLPRSLYDLCLGRLVLVDVARCSPVAGSDGQLQLKVKIATAPLSLYSLPHIPLTLRYLDVSQSNVSLASVVLPSSLESLKGCRDLPKHGVPSSLRTLTFSPHFGSKKPIQSGYLPDNLQWISLRHSTAIERGTLPAGLIALESFGPFKGFPLTATVYLPALRILKLSNDCNVHLETGQLPESLTILCLGKLIKPGVVVLPSSLRRLDIFNNNFPFPRLPPNSHLACISLHFELARSWWCNVSVQEELSRLSRFRKMRIFRNDGAPIERPFQPNEVDMILPGFRELIPLVQAHLLQENQVWNVQNIVHSVD